ncbi:esterase/lipase family protein [Streptomyces sp. NPDC127066]|uniref:esterase/lipase family protein n=1 Tax=Streptomyces sp. NPDC127066 TaxID=3347125 RepID=UPI0036611ADA
MDTQRQSPARQNSSPERELPPHVTQDAVVIVPGIMGSELRDTKTRKILWGLSGTRWLVSAWMRRQGLQKLHLTEEELAGATGRIEATQLLRHSTWTPYLRGQEPYTQLTDTVLDYVADPAAVCEFPYDWRLPVATNGKLLAQRAREHLTTWRNHPRHHQALAHRADQRPARLVFIAHSMGGLVTRCALDGTHHDDLAADTRTVITLGTPFYGAVKAAAILNSGRGAPVPLPHRKLQALCHTMPGLHDLLPLYRCLRTGDDVVRLDTGSVTALGGQADLARNSFDFHSRQQKVLLPGHRALAGTRQSTWQSLTLDSGMVSPHEDGARHNRDGSLIRDRSGRLVYYSVQGDGTVYRDSAAQGEHLSTAPVQHGDLARADTSLNTVIDILLEDEPQGPPLGEPGCGILTPDLVESGQTWHAIAEHTDSLQGLTCTVTDTQDDRTAKPARMAMRDGRPAAEITITDAGLYRVSLSTRDGHTVSQLVLVAEPGLDAAEAD